MVVFSLLFFFMAVYTIYRYFKNAPEIRLDERSVSIGGQSFSLAEIQTVELSGKGNFPFIISFPMEATAILFKDGSTRVIFDEMYENSWEIKSFLKSVVLDKPPLVPHACTEADLSDIRHESFITFRGNQFTSLRGLSLWGLIGVFLAILLLNDKSPSAGTLLFIACFCLIWFSINSYLMHYFLCSDTYFVVKNHNFTWKTKIYRLQDIREVVFETQGKQPNNLRVITKDFRSRLYPAGTLRDKTWLKLKQELEQWGIVVRNECILEE